MNLTASGWMGRNSHTAEYHLHRSQWPHCYVELHRLLRFLKTAAKDFQSADAELNRVYKDVLKLLDENEKKLLIKAQKDWIKFRDSHCAFEINQYEGGSIQPLIYSTCLTERTKNRIDDLNAIIESINNR